MKKTKLGLAKKGFTIIEVVLVLAIAGLIFLMVFYVVPQAMAGQRDGERRQAMARVQSALVQYQTNNRTKRNNLPPAGTITFDVSDSDESSDFGESCKSSACLFIKNYMNASGATTDTFLDPDGVPYNMTITENWAVKNDIGEIITSGNTGNATDADAGEGSSSIVLSQLVIGDDGESVTIGGSNPLKGYRIYVITGATCSGESAVKSEMRHFAVLYKLEGSGVYCGGSD